MTYEELLKACHHVVHLHCLMLDPHMLADAIHNHVYKQSLEAGKQLASASTPETEKAAKAKLHG